MECLTCGGTDFYKESGFFYCSDCQIQSQEIVEHVFQEEPVHISAKNAKRIRKPKQEKLDSKVTSWECYNIVMCALTQQLISLGADKNLKPIVKYLWMNYLEKLEILHLKHDLPPKLPIINSKKDAGIIYEVPKKKRKRKSSMSDASSISFASMRRQRSGKKRALAKVEYEVLSQKSLQEESTLHSETLTSLKSNSEKSEKQSPAGFNRYSVKELRKKMSRGHCRQHRHDKSQSMDCHKLTYKNCSAEYQDGVYFVSPIKLYCILYLGLLINRDKIQLGDLLRFIREGHLNFNNYKQLLPEDYLSKFLNVQNNNKNNLFSNHKFRTAAATMVRFLKITRYIKVVNILDLCQRFCKEMNLPDEVFASVENLISKTGPKLKLTNKSKVIPNYEGRAISFIIFTLKLLFGFDGETEMNLSKYAQLVNKQLEKPTMFDIVKWMTYINYRSLVINECHFPTFYSNNSNEINSDLFLQYVNSQKPTLDNSTKFRKEMRDYKELLSRLQESDKSDEFQELHPTLTPFREYSNTLPGISKYDREKILQQNFQEDSLDFLLRPNKYLQMVGEKVKINHGGANNRWIIENMRSYRSEMLATRQDHHLIPVEIAPRGNEDGLDTVVQKESPSGKKLDAKYVQENYEKCRQHVFDKNKHHLNRVSKRVKLDKVGKKQKSHSYNNHFYPYERYWLYLQMNVDRLNRKINEEFFNKHPSAFKLIFKECARIIEQTIDELLYDYQLCELFLVYAAPFGDNSHKPRRKLLGDNLQHYISLAESYW